MPHRRPILYSLIPGCRGASREQSCEHRGFRSRPVADAFGAAVLRGLQRRNLIRVRTTSQKQQLEMAMNSEELQPVGWLSEWSSKGPTSLFAWFSMAVKVIECSSGRQIPRMATTRPEFRSIQATS